MYEKYFKRVIDFILSFCAIVVLSPILIILIFIGAITMKGNPFFTQERPGLNEKVFRLIKYRTMTNERDKDGKLLPDEDRLNGYGKFLRSTSLDELPELFNIFVGQMAIIGPRPLLSNYLPWYTDEEAHRHDVRPGLTGLAQVQGRNAVNWDEKFAMDLKYIERITFVGDIKIFFSTIKAVVKREGISSENSVTMESFVDYCVSQGRTPRR